VLFLIIFIYPIEIVRYGLFEHASGEVCALVLRFSLPSTDGILQSSVRQ
jgi:hypothetical protein